MEAIHDPHSVVVVPQVNHVSGEGDKDLAGAAGGEAVVAAAAEEIVKERRSCASECSVEVDLEDGMVHLSKSERDCRICHMSLDSGNQESGFPIELGCSCKDDLAAAHKQCAETWFKIKGNKICEVCGSIACNIAGTIEAESAEHWNEANGSTQQAASAQANLAEARSFWQGHRFLNFLLACMVFAFVISWLFHFNVPS
ncbi:PREDICTED: uncharacterized protein LOC104826861 [Tarenaya hassleriana]|uniref:uncharacterized protein LOC104826861 n=1 Tax=Tarenaya hassleriana TaxID=28532 RepID=UPI00053C6D6B|nr:PREDICTED: uncharacterized protein LOC104826861 [Tarenaya hassleriana]